MHDYGGYCFAFFFDEGEDKTDGERPNEIFQKTIEYLEKKEGKDMEIDLLDYRIILHEPTTEMVTDIEMLFEHKEDGFIDISFHSVSGKI